MKYNKTKIMSLEINNPHPTNPIMGIIFYSISFMFAVLGSAIYFIDFWDHILSMIGHTFQIVCYGLSIYASLKLIKGDLTGSRIERIYNFIVKFFGKKKNKK